MCHTNSGVIAVSELRSNYSLVYWEKNPTKQKIKLQTEYILRKECKKQFSSWQAATDKRSDTFLHSNSNNKLG